MSGLIKRCHFLPIVFITSVSLITLWPSFKLALTGDDLLGLWRLNQKLGTNISIASHIRYVFTDYGPQDTITFIIHKYFGFNHIYYYLFAFLLRISASLSFIPLIFYITKNRTIAYLCALFFSVTTTGLEVNNWSFNMPSFISIAFINLHILYLFKIADNYSLKNNIASIIFFVLAIVSQPIRSAFLPVFSITTIFILMIKVKSFTKKTLLLQIPFILLFFYLIIAYSEIGGVFGISQNFYDRIHLKWFNPELGNFNLFTNAWEARNYLMFLYPLSQLGQIIFPFDVFPHNIEIIDNVKELTFLSLVLFVAYSVVRIALFKSLKDNKYCTIFVRVGTIWTVFLMIIFIKYYSYPIATSTYGGMLLGGYFLLFIISLLFNKNKISINYYILIFLSLITISFFAPWIRNPLSSHLITNRYLIIPAAGFTSLLGVIVHKFNRCSLIYLLFIGLLIINVRESYKYLEHLSVVRKAHDVDYIRNNIPFNQLLTQDNEKVIYFLESDNPEFLYHSLYFGFPFFLHFGQEVTNPWNIAATTQWDDIVSAYFDGESLKSFWPAPNKPLDLDHIFSLRIVSNELRDSTEETRNKLEMYTKMEN